MTPRIRRYSAADVAVDIRPAGGAYDSGLEIVLSDIASGDAVAVVELPRADAREILLQIISEI